VNLGVPASTEQHIFKLTLFGVIPPKVVSKSS
jgi:hypothetical protein